MTSEVQIYRNEVIGTELRIRFQDDDSFIVRATDVSDALSFRDVSELVRNIPAGHTVHVLERVPGINGSTIEREVTYLTEGAFYRVVGQRQAARIKNPEIRATVEQYQDWVFNDVLVTLRREGVKVDQYSRKDDDAIRAGVERQLEIRNYKDIIRETVKSMNGQRWLYGEIRNMFLKAVSGMDKNQLINSGREIQTWPGDGSPSKADRGVGSNYLYPEELSNFNDLIDYSAIEIRRNPPRSREELLATCSRAYKRFLLFRD